MITTEYKCDLCGKMQLNSGDNFFEVAVTIKSKDTHYFGSALTVGTKLFCRECCLKLGIVFPNKNEKKTETPITIEDLVREICQDEINSR